MRLARNVKSKPRNERDACAIIIDQWLESGNFPDRMLEDVVEHRAFVTEVVLGVVRRFRTLDWLIKDLRGGKPIHGVRAHLMVGMYELLYLSDTEAYAVVNETVELVKHRRDQQSANMVNALLRRAAREKDQLIKAAESAPPLVRVSHPDAIYRRWKKAYGEQRAIKLCEWNNQRPEVIVHVNRLQVSPADFKAALRERDIEIKSAEAGDGFFAVPRGIGVMDLPGYEEGWFSVQDPATELAIEVLDPMPGEKILDACAAPGGKTALIAERMKHEGVLYAMESHGARIKRLEQNVTRLKLSGVHVVQGDATRDIGKLDVKFDAILLDVPCTNTGVIRRKPDVRWSFSEDKIKALRPVQVALLDGAAPHVRSGGRIVYSTCSLEAEENEELVRRWVAKHDDFEMKKGKKLFPPKSQTDGAYAALLEKK